MKSKSIKYMGSHCWHWSSTSEVVRRPQEVCCNCRMVIEEPDRWFKDNGECEWETYE